MPLVVPGGDGQSLAPRHRYGLGSPARATGEPFPGALAVTAGGFASEGVEASGEWTPASMLYRLANTGYVALDWIVSAGACDWLTVDVASGTLLGGAHVDVTVSIDADADALEASETPYEATLTFTNETNGTGDTTRDVTLTVNAAPYSGIMALTGSLTGAPW